MARPVFTKRIPRTAGFSIDGTKLELYQQVTRFVKRQSRRAAAQGRTVVRERSELRDVGANHTVLDRVHAAMLFQLGGHTATLRALIEAGTGAWARLMHLANALSALYPRGSQEKRLLDAMLLAAPK